MHFSTTTLLLLSSLLPSAGGRLLGAETGFEAVSSEPKTIEPPEEIYIDRRHLLADPIDEERDRSYWTHDINLDSSDLNEEVEGTGGSEDEPFDSSFSEWDGSDESDFETGYAFEASVDFDEDGFETVGEAKVASLPIARRLRRVGALIDETESEFHPDELITGSNAESLPTDEENRDLGGCTMVILEFQVDKYGKETTVSLKRNGNAIMESKNEVEAYGKKVMKDCVPNGDYDLVLYDRDGICCKNGQGYYKLTVGGTVLISGGYFIGTKSFPVKIGYDYTSKMGSRDKLWAAAQNSRRRTYHKSAGVSYRALKWAPSLASDAQSWANRLLSTCSQTGINHESNVSDGENLAKNVGKGAFGQQYSPDKIVGRWVEMEEDDKWPHNAHLTQTVWRSSVYTGCGDASKSMGDGGTCHVQVCRYVRPGNCGVKNGNWRAEAFKDDTPCGRSCPSEGCYN